MDKKQPSGPKRKTSSGKKRPSQARRSNRLSQADRQALTLLDRIVETDRQIEQKYSLPFRAPRQVAASLQQCVHCRKDIALLIFGDSATDAVGLEAYARLTTELIQQTDLPTYVIAPPSNPGNVSEKVVNKPIF